jgi:hypothetical protein
MIPSCNKSRPEYGPLKPDLHGTRHWFLTSDATWEDRANALAALADLTQLEIWSVDESMARAGAGATHALPAAVARWFDDESDLFWALEHAMREAQIGVRIYALGTEPFIWAVRQLAARFAIAPEAVRVAHSGSLRRRVYCIHCRCTNEHVTSNVVTCKQCGRYLSVRDHFSRRLTAFMGVQADAEVPGELPESMQHYL